MEEITNKYKPLLTASLKQFLQEKQRTLTAVNPWAEDTITRLTDFATRGKMIRGALILLSAEMFGSKKPTESAIKCALALELAHSALLVHDDIMDQDLLRRGEPTIFAQYQNQNQKQRIVDRNHYGESQAICFGDLTIFLAFEILASLSEPQTRGQIITFFAQELAKVCLGQMQDVRQGYCRQAVELKDILNLYTYKTARYTFSLPLAMGGLLTKQDAATINNLLKLGETLGLLFQIKDDELGLFGDSQITGKPVGADIKAGKQTLYYFYVYRHAKADEKQKLKEFFGKPEATAGDINYFRELISKYQISLAVDTLRQKLEAQSQDLIKNLPVANTYQSKLLNLLKYLKNRNQ